MLTHPLGDEACARWPYELLQGCSFHPGKRRVRRWPLLRSPIDTRPELMKRGVTVAISLLGSHVCQYNVFDIIQSIVVTTDSYNSKRIPFIAGVMNLFSFRNPLICLP